MSQSNEKKRGRSPQPKQVEDETEHVPGTPLVIGIGASAGSIEAIAQLLPKLLPTPDQAIVVVLQHRESLDEARLRETLDAMDGHFSKLEDGVAPQGGGLYLCAPNLIVTLEGGRFHTRTAEQRPGSRGTIDSFFVSLAEDRGEGCLGVILYGTAGDGTLGIARIKECGGLTIAEAGPDDSVLDPATGNLPGSLADFVVPLLEIPERIKIYARHLTSLRERKGLEEMLTEVSGHLAQIAVILRNKTGHDFHGYKKQTFLRRVQRRMQVVQIDDVETYLGYLRDNPEEVQHLFNDLLIGVTQFFRDAREFEVLEREVVPKILENKNSGDNVRIWVLGCATGEEAYSIGILLREEMARREIHPTVQIFATDIDVRALAAARVGRYADSIANDVSPERLGRWFVKEGNTYLVVKELREMCIFSAHNVVRDAPFSKLDLISCRNLLIYLTGELQNRVIPLFHFALLRERYLFLGNSENVSRHPKLFGPVDRRARIFRKLDTPVRVLPEFPLATARRVDGLHDARPVNTGADGGLTRRAERIAERYAPAYVITDAEFQVLHFSGRTGRYIEPNAGAASLDLLNLVHRDLRLDVRAALMKATETNEPVHVDDLQMGTNGNQLRVDLVIEPVREGADKRRNFVVIFKDGPLRALGQGEPLAASGQLRDEHVLRLEGELRVTRERLQSSVEELESTNEELKSSNEEYQSLNEELQSANEELETSREELQSVNEELTTVNNELAHRVHELTRATSDLKNFLESTQIATVFLDNDLKVMNFTPAVTDIFHLVETDIGRPIAHIKSRIPFEELQEDVRRVLRTLTSIERAIEDPASKARYIVRILPYRSTDNFIAGVVVTFVDVTPLTRAEERQKMLLAELQHRVRNTLSVVRSIARRTAETSTNVEEFAAHLEGRLAALGRVQATVTRDPASGVDLATLVAEELLAHAAHEGEQATISGPNIRLRAKPAETLALAVHELSANAVKYGALTKSDGRVRIDWKIKQADGASTLVFNWAETGGPLIDGIPQRRGFGTELLEQTLSYELKAATSLTFAKQGLACTIELPLNGRTAFESAIAMSSNEPQ